ncbi:hypothetical protein [Microbacterium phyllosphaerae]|uniref:hypothetical protein n=1 Tax=Microbacterium phyllosphaerae TaxID=124798 RepID=UPI003D649B32
MNDTELGSLLREAAPQVTTPANLDAHSTRILREARQRRGRGMRWLVGAAACIVAIGGSSVAMAGGGNETPWGWVADNVLNIESTDGSACFQGFLVKWEGVADDDPIVQDAKMIVGTMDLEALDLTAMEAVVRDDYANAVDEDGERSPIEASDTEIMSDALNRVVAETLFAELEARGHEMSPGHEVSLYSQSTECR